MSEATTTTSTMASTTAAAEAVTSTVASAMANASADVRAGEQHDFSSSFLQHASGQGIAGIFAWAAICVTCHQVRLLQKSKSK